MIPYGTTPGQALSRSRLLLVDDQPLKLHFLHDIFQADYELFSASNGYEALTFCQAELPDLVLLDVKMSGMDGYEVCRYLKRDPRTSDIPVIFVTAYGNAAEEEEGLAAGAVDFISTAASPNVMRARVKTHLALKYQSDLLRSLALVDGLTGIANRRHFDLTLTAEWRHCARLGKPLALIMIDIDFFKQFNDRYGHQAGDACLIRVAACLKAGLNRPHDLVARYGGEEFACILPDTSFDGAERKAQFLLKAVQALAIPHEKSALAGGVVSISLGVAGTVPASGNEAVGLVECADQMLYAAKQGGRAQVKSMSL